MIQLFQKNLDHIIRNFYINASSNNHVAYGPGSIINGSVMLTLNKPLLAYGIRVIFDCKEYDVSKKETTTIFSVDTVIWGGHDTVTTAFTDVNSDNQLIDLKPQEISSGSHMYLFAIQLPHVNYPPSMHDNVFGHRIHYALQGIIDLVSAQQSHHTTTTIPILYLPLVMNPVNETVQHTQVFYQKQDKQVQMTAELIKPAYCPGDLCTVKVLCNSQSDSKVTEPIQVSFIALATISMCKHHTLASDSFLISIPKHAKNHQEIFKLQLPSNIVPTFTNRLGKYIDINYEIHIKLPHHDHFHISLPISINTVPIGYPMDMTIRDTNELPLFIPNVESPIPSTCPLLIDDDDDDDISIFNEIMSIRPNPLILQ